MLMRSVYCNRGALEAFLPLRESYFTFLLNRQRQKKSFKKFRPDSTDPSTRPMSNLEAVTARIALWSDEKMTDNSRTVGTQSKYEETVGGEGQAIGLCVKHGTAPDAIMLLSWRMIAVTVVRGVAPPGDRLLNDMHRRRLYRGVHGSEKSHGNGDRATGIGVPHISCVQKFRE